MAHIWCLGDRPTPPELGLIPVLTNRRIIVTGGASGIGASTVHAYVVAGAQLVSIDIRSAEGEAVVAKANTVGPGYARYRHCDVADRVATRDAIDWAVAELGGLDVLVHIAGVQRNAPGEEVDDAHWNLMLDVNARGTMHANQAAYTHMREQGGHIVNFASSAGIVGMIGAAAYSASKGAVLAWSRCLAQEWARYRIQVNCIAPAMWTPMYDGHRASMTPEGLIEHDERMKHLIPLGGKLGNSDSDLAPFMVFMASEGARFITGQTIPVDGGMVMLR